MTLFVLMALAGGVLVGISRQVNGRLSLSTSPLIASFWNHVVGLAALLALASAVGGLFPEGIGNAPWYAYIGGPIGVVFVASGSWLIARIGAVNTAILVIAGQMVSGVVLDLFRNTSPTLWASALGIVLILTGTALTHRR